MNQSIYLDHAATTPLHPEVLQAMMPYWTTVFGNPSSLHAFGRAAYQAVSDARDILAQQLQCHSNQLIFTSGGTESDNLALFGIARQFPGKHIITSQIEHHAVLHACQQLEREGYRVTYLPVDETGQVSVHDVEAAIEQDTVLISIMYGNNEVGTIQPIEAIGALARSKGILFHVDAVQVLGHIPLRLSQMPVDLMSFSAHKINGPKGTGALYVAAGVKLESRQFGGSQERKRRAGTENVAGIVGFSAALRLNCEHLVTKERKMLEIRHLFIEKLSEALSNGAYVVNGSEHGGLAHILNVSFPGVSTEVMLMNLDLAGIAAASGSACTSGSLEVSHVLRAMKLSDERMQSAVRFSFGMDTTMGEITETVKQLATIVRRIRSSKIGLSGQ